MDPIANSSASFAPMSCSSGGCDLQASAPRGIASIQWITILWMLVECGVALVAAAQARSTALLAFGADSLIELLSATVVLLQFSRVVNLSEERASRLAGMLLYVLAGLVVLASAASLLFGIRADCSSLGIGITAAALIVMPGLSWMKRRTAVRTGNAALAADAVQSATCAYLAAITLAGLALNQLFHISWVDSVAALLAVPVLWMEAGRAMRGEVCC
jgi:hypothetical protein